MPWWTLVILIFVLVAATTKRKLWIFVREGEEVFVRGLWGRGIARPGLRFFVGFPVFWAFQLESQDMRDRSVLIEVKKIDTRPSEEEGGRSLSSITANINVRIIYRFTSAEAVVKMVDPEGLIRDYIRPIVSDVAAGLAFLEMKTDQPTLASKIKEGLGNLESLNDWPVSIKKIIVEDVLASDDVRFAIDEVETAKLRAQARKAEAEGEKVAKITLAEADRQALQLEAVGLAQIRLQIGDAAMTAYLAARAGSRMVLDEKGEPFLIHPPSRKG